ncbi:MAG TPA: ABC transporter permease [Candidatus Limnocylindrales bacterium]|nr:ABC transporter permease [Candidatus Limnocylindrales bacterium]
MSTSLGSLSQAGPGSSSAPGAAGRIRVGRRSLAQYLPAIVVFVGALVVFEFVLDPLGIRSFLIPRPSAILAALQANWATGRFALLPAAVATLQEALLGLVIGTILGVAVAFATARWATARGVLLPLAVAANAIPIIAFAPLLNNWFGLLNPLSKALMAAVLVFFPVMANVTRGLVQVDPGAIELMRSYAASEWTILRKVRVPNALPYFFTALKVVTTFSLIGAIVAEYFGGSNSSLGRRIVESASAFKFEITWGAILLGAMTGIVFYLVVVAIERAVIPWAAALRGDT